MNFILRTHGCRANQYDSEVVRSMLLASGAAEVRDGGEADVAIFNSCSVTAAAEAELRKDIRRLAIANPRLKTIVMGCAPGLSARDERTNPLRSLPTVSNLVVGADLDAIASAVGIPAEHARSVLGRQMGARALLRIQDGCDEHCTFCMTTLARGSNRSRSTPELVKEASLLAQTHPEIVLTGIHIGSYGSDIGGCLSRLVEELIAKVPEVRFRLSSLEATEVDERLRELFDEPTRLAPHLHAPLQSGSDRILKRMGRNWYTARDYEASIERIIAGRDVFGLGADIICGFPGETVEDHEATVAIVNRLPFTSLHVFPYSARPGTPAIRLDRQTGSEAIQRRSTELREMAAAKSLSYRKLQNDRQADIVAVRPSDGLTGDYLSVKIEPAARRRERFSATLKMNSGDLTATRIVTPAA